MNDNYKSLWNELHKNFKQTDSNVLKYDSWLEEYKEIIEKCNTKIIDLGCGVSGNNTLYLTENNKQVIACDFAEEAIDLIKEKLPTVETKLFDMVYTFPFEDNITDLVIADLSLHYFKEKDLNNILKEIKRILTNNGHLLVRLNSTDSDAFNSIKENNEEEVEHNLYLTKNMLKRFFNEEDINNFFKEYEIVSKKQENMGRYGTRKIVWNCLLKNK